MEKELKSAAIAAASSDEFIHSIQSDERGSPDDLLSAIYRWEQSDPKRIEEYKHAGWFRVASDYYDLLHS